MVFSSGRPTVLSRRVSDRSLYANGVLFKSSNTRIPSYWLPPVPTNVCRSMSRCEKETRARGSETVAARLWTGFRCRSKMPHRRAVIILIDTQARPRRPACPSRVHALTLARAFARCRRYALAAHRLTRHTLWPGWKENASARLPPSASETEGEGFRGERGHARPQETRGVFAEYRRRELIASQASVR